MHVLDIASHLEAMKKQIFGNCNSELSGGSEDLGPLEDFLNVLLYPSGASGNVFLQLFFDLDHQFCRLHHISVLKELDFSLKISNNALTAVVAGFDLSKLIVTSELVDETS